MANPSFAEIKAKFNEKALMGLRTPKIPTNVKSSGDSSMSEMSDQLKSNGSNQSFDDEYSVVSDPTISSTQASNEVSSSYGTKLAHILQHNINSGTPFKKPPVPLPSSAIGHRNEDIHSGTSSITQDSMTSQGLKKPPVPLPASATRHRNEDIQDLISHPIISHSVTKATGFKKPPVPLPSSINQDQDREISSMSQDYAVLHSAISTSASHLTGTKKPPVPLPSSVNQDQDREISSISQDYAVLHSAISPSANHVTGTKKPPVPLPDFASRAQTNNLHSESVALDEMLPSKCMFFEFENMINDYQRRDPQIILYPKLKPTMPKMTTNDIHILEIYSNT
ncbi:unnamed protein product [Adineta steineri]|uniref:Uncharacterized protein n=1 Tax=Adineta steineri TaxID=433720 RepID=A0A813VSV5_9BILA|nr:unnamed protein product [Adineta steineri]